MDQLSPFPPRMTRTPVMIQNWNRISFLHWRYPAQSIQRLLPPGLAVDLYDSCAWVGLIPFVVEGLRPPFLPPLPCLSRFPETNVRTYVKGPDASRGIWFFTLEAARTLAVIGARSLYGLPYRRAAMEVEQDGDTLTYSSSRQSPHGPAATRIVIQIGRSIRTTSQLENFLTARFRMFALRRGRLWSTDVHHPPWPLHEARVVHLEQSLFQSLALDPPLGEPLAHYSHGVLARVSAPAVV